MWQRSQSTGQVRSNWSLISLHSYSLSLPPPFMTHQTTAREEPYLKIWLYLLAHWYVQDFSEARNFRFPNAPPAHLLQSSPKFPTLTPYQISLFTKTIGALKTSFALRCTFLLLHRADSYSRVKTQTVLHPWWSLPTFTRQLIDAALCDILSTVFIVLVAIITQMAAGGLLLRF